MKIPKEEPIVFCSTNAIVGHRRILSLLFSSSSSSTFFLCVFPSNWLLKNLLYYPVFFEYLFLWIRVRKNDNRITIMYEELK